MDILQLKQFSMTQEEIHLACVDIRRLEEASWVWVADGYRPITVMEGSQWLN